MAFEAAIAKSAANMLKFNALQSGIRARQYTSAVPYFAFARAAQMVQNVALSAMQAGNIGEIRDHIPALLSSDFSVPDAIKSKEGTDVVVAVREALERNYKGLYENWITGIYQGVGTAYSGAMEQFLGTGDLLWAYKHLANRIGVTPKMARHWMNIYRPTIPNATMAFDMWMKDLISEADFKKLATYDGWSDKYIDLLKKASYNWPTARMAFRLMARGYMPESTYKKYVTAAGWPYFPTKGWDEAFKTLYAWWPSAYEAFFMWKKGIIGKSERDKYYKGQGYPAELYAKITANFEYIPTLYDLIRIADYQEIDLIWATDVMKKRGLRPKDISKFIDYLKYRPLREEVRNLTNQLLYRYRYGRMTPTDFATELDKLSLGVTEKSLLTDYAEMLYEDELITEQMDILMWRFRMAWITEEDYLDELISLGIREEKANLIVEAEKARGYFGYY